MLSIEQKTDNLFKFFFDNSIDLLCVANTNGFFEKLNPEWEKVLGYNLDELEGKPYINFIHPDDIASTNDATKELTNNKEVHNYRNRYKHKNGNYIWLEWRSFPKGNKIYAIARDITENIKYEEIAKQKVEINKLIASITTDYVFRLEITNKKERFAYIAGNIEIIRGEKNKKNSEIKSTKELIHPSHYNNWIRFIEQIIKTGSNAEIECLSNCNYQNRWIHLIAKPLKDNNTHLVKSIYVAAKNITERKRADLKQKQNEALIKATMESINDGMLIVSENNELINYNSRICEIFSLHKNIFKTSNSDVVFDAIHKLLIHYPDYSERIKQINSSHESSNDILDLKNLHIIKQLSFPLKDESPIKGRVWLFRDVTLNRTAEKALRESESKFRNLAESALVGIYLVQNNKFKYVNPCFADIHGYEVEELIDTINPKDLIVPENLQQSTSDISEEKTHLNSAYQKIRIVTKFGEVRYAESLGTLTKFNGKPAIIGTLTDITEKIKVERALLKSQSQLLKSQKIAHMGSWKIDLITENLLWDKQTYKIFGIDENTKPLKISNFMQAVHPDDRHTLQVMMQESIDSKRIKDFECRIIRPDNEIRILNNGGEVILDNEGKPVEMNGFVQDITERKLAENAKLQSLKFLENLDKINLAIQSTDDYLIMINNVARIVNSIFVCDRTFFIQPYDQDLNYWIVSAEYTNPDYPGIYDVGKPIALHKNMKTFINYAFAKNEPVEFYPDKNINPEEEPWRTLQVKSLLGIVIRSKVGYSWLFGIQQCSFVRKWTSFDKNLFKEISRRLSDRLSNLLIRKDLFYNEQFLNKIFENIPNIIMVKDAKTSCYLRLNKAGENILGYTQQNIIGKRDADIFPKQKADFYEKKDEETLRDGKLIEFQHSITSIITKKEIVLYTKKIPILDENKKPKIIIDISEDITCQKQIETERSQNLMFLENLDRINRFIQRSVNLEKMVTDVLDELIRIFNIDRAYLLYPLLEDNETGEISYERTKGNIPKVFSEEILIAQTPLLKKFHTLLLKSKTPLELRYKKEVIPDKEPWKRLQIKTGLVFALYPKTGLPWQIGLHHCKKAHSWQPHEKKLFKEICHRITDGLTSLLMFRKQKENEEFLDKVFENIPYAISVKDAKTLKYLKVNKAAEKIFGLSTQELVGKQSDFLVPKEKAEYMIKLDKKSIENRTIVRDTQKVKTKNNKEIILRTTKIPVLNESGDPKYIVGISEDISEQSKSDAQRAFNLTLLESLDRVNRAMQSTNTIESMIQNVLNEVLLTFNCDRSFLLCPEDSDTFQQEQFFEYSTNGFQELNKPGIQMNTLNKLYKDLLSGNTPIELNIDKSFSQKDKSWKDSGVKSLLATALTPKVGKPWLLVIQQYSHSESWTKQEKVLFQEISRRVADGLGTLLINRVKLDNEEFLNKIFENIPNMIFIKDAETLSFMKFNKAGEDLLGYSRKELIGKNDYDFFPKKEADFFTLKDREVLKSEKLLDIKEEKIKNSNNEIRILHTKKLPIIGKDGMPRYLLGISEDITERKKTETALLETKELLQSFMDSATDSMTIFDKDLRLIKYNEITLSYFSDTLKGENIIGYPLKDFTYKINKIYLYDEAVKVFQTGIPYQSKDLLVVNAENKFWFDMKIFKVGDGIGILNSNITPIKLAEQKIMKINSELEEHVKQRTAQLEQANNDLESFAYSVSHDLRAPLRHITGFLEKLYSSIESHNETVQKYFEKINRASYRMSNMIDELLNFSRLGRKTLRIVPIQLEVMLNLIIEQLKPDYADREINWKINDLPKIKGDESLLKIAFENIISNAIKYTSKKETPTIEVGTIDDKKEYITIYVKDNGAGFDMKYIDRLFGVFQRLHSFEEFEGIGIGLANVKQIVTKHNGFITAESQINKGTTFYISLPTNIEYE